MVDIDLHQQATDKDREADRLEATLEERAQTWLREHFQSELDHVQSLRRDAKSLREQGNSLPVSTVVPERKASSEPMGVSCPICSAAPGEQCKGPAIHAARIRKVQE